MEVVGVLLGVVAGELDEGGAGFFVEGFDVTDDPVSGGEGADGVFLFPVDKGEVVVAGAFAEPEDFVGVGKESVVAVAEDVDELVGGFFDDDGLEAGVGIDFDEAILAKAALDVGESEEVFFGVPTDVVKSVGVFDKGVADGDGFAVVGEENDGVGDVELVAGFGVGVEFVFWLDLVFGRGSDEVDLVDGVAGVVGEEEAGGI